VGEGQKDYPLITKKWDCLTGEEIDSLNISGMARQYMELARTLRGIKTFGELPGGATALSLTGYAENIHSKQAVNAKQQALKTICLVACGTYDGGKLY